MKKYLILVAFIVLMGSTTFAQGDGIKFTDAPWEEILAQAAKEDKLIFMDAYAEWCGPCKMMAKNSFPQKSAGDLYNANFINVQMDMEKGIGRELAKKYEVRAYPTLLFLDEEGNVVHRSIGYQTAEQLVELGEAASDPDRQLASLDARYKKGDRDAEFLYNYTKARYEVMDGSYKEVAEEYMKTQTDWTTPGNQEFILVFADGVNSKLFQYMMNHRQAFVNQFGEELVSRKIQQAIYSEISTPGNSLKLEDVQAIYSKTYQNEPEIAEQLFAEFKINYYQMAGDMDKFADATIAYLDKYEADDATQLNNYAWAFYENVTDKAKLKKAVEWAEKSVELDKQYFNMDTLAALYFKAGQKKKALKTAKAAIEVAKANDEDYSGTTALIEEIKNS